MALEVAKMRYQEEQTGMAFETNTVYEMLESVKSECMRQPELEAKLMKSITDIAELKANLMDKENTLQSLSEENETLKLEAGRKEAGVQQLEQDVRMRLGYVTEEANKRNRRAA
ncbi:interactor of constitutive active ROPs 2, chloroplastic [Hordeum vulgare]|nr:interactor of constitutive active ROPs 2, chloroplastic [Hordeum vulgare]